ncbi:polyunsaturated fatty acid 5-lipoxygenase-like [Paramisgurnus dabryanus]|uniref:polyunsaturated fatty acid 5-lipoxygenase-like n=1 Tax=Paramisgurnus dabryanus TaxID=90735 RepID=UPI0031F387C0
MQTSMMTSKTEESPLAVIQTTECAAQYADTNLIYNVLVSTGGVGVRDFSLTLLDSNNHCSVKTLVNKPVYGGFSKEISVEITGTKELGDIALVKIEQDNCQWFCMHIKVKTPSGKCFEFPCYRWIDKNEVLVREGSARLPQDETEFLKKRRQEELESRKEIFRWIQRRPGFPQSIEPTLNKLPLDVQFDEEKQSEFTKNTYEVFVKLDLGRYKDSFQSWKDFADLEKIFTNYETKNTLLENVIQDWNTDYMFGYQFLNGCNPVMIRKCMKLPDKFPVTHEMVKGSLQRGLTLQDEIKKGNIYIADYEILAGLPANKAKNTQYYLTAPICLLYNNRVNQIVPIAIQLSQTPGEKSPIFLPDDNEYDWMLAKMWVKSSDFNVHQLVTHLLKTHLISEVFEVAMYRQLSAAHPVYKLLIPHVRFTMAINAEARIKLISDDGFFGKSSSVSGNGIDQLMERATKTLTLKSLCFPETIKARGMENAPKYYYRDDGMMIWKAIHCFVSDVVEIYYAGDEKVQKDVEIQGFVKNVSFGLLDSKGEKFPQSLNTRAELTEYLTAVIFNASAQHAAVNFGQFEWDAWIPNSPSTMRKPPPIKKGEVDLKYFMESLPDRDSSSGALGTTWALSRFQKNERYLGMYPDMRFTEPAVKEAIKKFHKKLNEVTDSIKRRNEGLTMEYCYLSPNKIPNSVAI